MLTKDEYHLSSPKSCVFTNDTCVTDTLKRNTNLNNLNLYNHHLITKNQVYSLDKLHSKEYNIFILDNSEKPT